MTIREQMIHNIICKLENRELEPSRENVYKLAVETATRIGGSYQEYWSELVKQQHSEYFYNNVLKAYGRL